MKLSFSCLLACLLAYLLACLLACLLAHSMRTDDCSVKNFSTHHGALLTGFQFILQSILISNISIDSVFVSHAEGYSPT